VSGRILRFTDAPNQQAFLFMPAEPKLVKYAYRVAQDIPDALSKVKFIPMAEEITAEVDITIEDEATIDDEDSADTSTNKPILDIGDTITDTNETPDVDTDEIPKPINDTPKGEKPVTTEKIMGIFGQFNHIELEIDGFEHLVISDKSIAKLNEFSTQVF